MNPKPHRSFARAGFLFAAVVATAVCWDWNRRVHLPDPGIVIRTDAEAVAGIREFLAAAKNDTSDYDLAHPNEITRDRLKGQTCWRVVWLPKPDAKSTNKLSALAGASGWFSTSEKFDFDHGIEISGVKTNQSGFDIWRIPYTQIREPK